MMKERHIYLDHAATTPCDPAVVESMAPYFADTFGNPSSAHWFGWQAIQAVDEARTVIAEFLGCSPFEVYFTGSATEADNSAVMGTIVALAAMRGSAPAKGFLPHIVMSAIEHEAVLEPCQMLEKTGMAEVTSLPVGRDGIIDPEEVRRALRPMTALISIMYANSEIGTIQPIAEIGKIIKEENERRAVEYLKVKSQDSKAVKLKMRQREAVALMTGGRMRQREGTINPRIYQANPPRSGGVMRLNAKCFGADEEAKRPRSVALMTGGRILQREPLAEGKRVSSKLFPIRFHTDAVQAAQFLDCNVNRLNVDLLTLSAHKIYGPKGIGALYIRRGTPLEPLVRGGGQERGVRAGTENVPFIVGFAEAIRLLREKRHETVERISRLRDRLTDGILEEISGTLLNGSRNQRLPNNVNIFFRGIEGEVLLMALDKQGIAVSTGSACASRSLKPSRVLQAIGIDLDQGGALRFSLGKDTTEEEIEYTTKVVKEVVEKLRSRK